MFSKIITVTLNPSLDVTLWIEKFDLDEPVKCEKEKDYPGGKGLNVSRVLTALSVENIAVGITGKDNKEKLSRLLDLENVIYNFVENDGAIRENFSIVVPNGKMLKINRKGFFVAQSVLDGIREKIKQEIEGFDSPLIIFAGSLPQNVTKEQYKSLVLEFKQKGAIIVLDNDIFSVKDLKEIAPFLIKPNCVELAHMFDKTEITDSEITDYAQILAAFTTHVLISMGENGLFYCSKNECMVVAVPKVEVKSTVGAGDSTLAGFIAALHNDNNVEYALRFAASCGTASVRLDGTEVITKEQVETLFDQMKII
ncbi:MAG: 1-phosphofructokinase family hexose kinase [Oscillospiraceae bacterium]